MVNGIVRLNTNGSRDNTFNSGTGIETVGYDEIETIIILNDDKIVIGGLLNSYNGTAITNLARLNADGSIDATFIPPSNINTGIPRSLMAVQTDGKIIITRKIFEPTSVSSYGIIRLNTNGSVDPTFNMGTISSGNIKATVLQPDGKIIIGGTFYVFNGTVTNNIARINSDGTLDATFNIGTGFPYVPLALALQSDGKIITFNSAVVRINPDGALDPTFYTGTVFNLINIDYDNPSSIKIQSDGKILIGSSFGAYNGVRNLVRLYGSCTMPTTATISVTGGASICNTETKTINVIAGILNEATNWNFYSGSCGGTLLGTGTSLVVTPTVTTTYFVRGNGACVTSGDCSNIIINYSPINTSFTYNGFILAAQATGVNYQWIDCNNSNNPVLGETNSTFKPTLNGYYGLQVNNSICTYTSACYFVGNVGLIEQGENNNLMVYPNPFSEMVKINFAVNNTEETPIILYDIKGVIVKQNNEKRTIGINEIIFDLKELSNGAYFVKYGIHTKKIIK